MSTNKHASFVLAVTKYRSVARALNFMYKHIDDLLIAEEYAEVDEILQEVVPCELDPTLTVGFLTITFMWREHLAERQEVYEAAEAHFAEIFPPERLPGLLGGLSR